MNSTGVRNRAFIAAAAVVMQSLRAPPSQDGNKPSGLTRGRPCWPLANASLFLIAGSAHAIVPALPEPETPSSGCGSVTCARVWGLVSTSLVAVTARHPVGSYGGHAIDDARLSDPISQIPCISRAQN